MIYSLQKFLSFRGHPLLALCYLGGVKSRPRSAPVGADEPVFCPGVVVEVIAAAVEDTQSGSVIVADLEGEGEAWREVRRILAEGGVAAYLVLFVVGFPHVIVVVYTELLHSRAEKGKHLVPTAEAGVEGHVIVDRPRGEDAGGEVLRRVSAGDQPL